MSNIKLKKHSVKEASFTENKEKEEKSRSRSGRWYFNSKEL